MASIPLVVVVDDEPDILECIRDLVEGVLSYATLTATSGPEALRLLAALGPDDVHLLVADYHMHPVNGLELLEAARALHPGLPTVLCTAYGDLGVAVEAVNRAHVSRYLPKPIDPDAFLDLVRELVAQARSERGRLGALQRAVGLAQGRLGPPAGEAGAT